MRGFWRLLSAAAVLLLSACVTPPALAQNAVVQSGAIVPFHGTSWFGNSVIGDAGTPSTPYVSSFGLFNGANCPFGISSQTGPGPSGDPHSLFTICQTLGATTFNVQGVGGQPTPSVYFNIGGTLYPFPGTGTGTVTSVGISGGATGLTATGSPVTSSGTITLGGIVGINAGGTGQNTAAAALTALLPTQAGQSGKVLGTNGSVASWTTSSAGSGTVTSITAGANLTGGTITTSGTIGLGAAVALQTANNTFTGTNAFTGFNNFSPGLSTSGAVPLAVCPSDYGVGKPCLSVQKNVTANGFTIGLYDGSSNNGSIALSASTVSVPSALTVGGSITLGGSAVCTQATGCTGGGGGGAYATIYDVAGTYGGDPTGAADTVGPFNAALAACSGTGGTIWFRAGNFRFNSGINANVTGCNVVGSGPQATNFLYYGGSGNFVSVNAYNVNVSGIAFVPGGAWSSGFGLAIGVSAGASLGLYNDLYFSGIPGFIYVTGASETKVTNIYGVNPTGAAAFQCDGAGATQVFGTRWVNVALGYGSTNTSTNGFHMGSGCNTWALTQVSSSGAGGGSGNNCLLVDNGSAFLVLEDFECDHSVAGATIGGGTGIQINNSWFGSTLAGNGLTFGSGFAGFASVNNSHIRDNSNAGVLINGSGGVQVVGNVISGNAAGNVLVGANVSNFQITNNQLGVPGDPTATYGVAVNTGTSNYYNVSSNICGSNNTNCVVDGGSGAKKFLLGNIGP